MARKIATPRDQQRVVMAFDGGSYSIKFRSDEGRGSFLSLCAPAPHDTLGSFNRLTDDNSYDLNVLTGRAQGRWIVGRQASGRENMKRYTRNMQRFDDLIFDVFMCAALRAANPQRGRPLEDLDKNRGIIDGRWRVPVNLTVSIAPGYYGNAAALAEAAKKTYDFIDMQSKRLYCFTVERISVVPESWGIYASQLYGVKDGEIFKKGARRFIESKIGVFDAGGRSTDIMVWENGKPLEKNVTSGDEGIILTAQKIVEDIMYEHSRDFPSKPDVLEVIAAMDKARSKGDVILRGALGKPIVVNVVCNRHMNEYASRAWELYQNFMQGGQGIEGLLYGGGGIVLAKPYMEQNFKHEVEYLAARTLEGMYMANADGAYLYAKFMELKRNGSE